MEVSSTYKNVFVGGVARAGKSTFLKKMGNLNKYNHFPLDYVIASLKNNFMECNISDSVVIGDSSENVGLLLSTIAKIVNSKEEKVYYRFCACDAKRCS